ncbi:MAG: RHS domain-containing protein [Deltaproteobacteria bacterium]|nr:RHS domain-containing protein [Deltaproteobacteria bacterium]MBW2075754.1 RHS domain-containing protein [Deltaproteobacteria bacterium]
MFHHMLDEITGPNPVVFSYDANGNTTGMGDKIFVYNQNNRLIKAAEGDITIGEYIYNALGQRAIKTADGQRTLFIYDQQGNLIAEADNDGNIVNEYIYLDGRLMAGVKSGIKVIEATIDIDPDTLNINSKGRWITCYIELPEAYDVADIDVSTVVLEGSVYAKPCPTNVGDHDKDGIADLLVKFDRSEVGSLLEPGEEVTVTIDGEVEGILFAGEDTIRVIDKGKKEKKEKKGKRSKKTKKTKAGKSTSMFCATSATTQQAKGMYYYHLDHLGTPQMMTDKNGEIVWKADYEPFGEAEVDMDSTVVNNFRFPGQYWDGETGLHYNYHRYYDPKTGRYLTADPIGLLGGINLYPYAQLNPIYAIDPFGLWFIDVGVSGAASGTWGPGGTTGLQISPSGLYWYYGVGLGIGGGFSATYHPVGEPSEEVSVTSTVRGGTGLVGAQAGASLGEDGPCWTWGAGYGLGFGATVTATQTIQVIDLSPIYDLFSKWFGYGEAAEEEPCK